MKVYVRKAKNVPDDTDRVMTWVASELPIPQLILLANGIAIDGTHCHQLCSVVDLLEAQRKLVDLASTVRVEVEFV